MHKTLLYLRDIYKRVSSVAFKLIDIVTLDGILGVSTFGGCDVNTKITEGCYESKLTFLSQYFKKYFTNRPVPHPKSRNCTELFGNGPMFF